MTDPYATEEERAEANKIRHDAETSRIVWHGSVSHWWRLASKFYLPSNLDQCETIPDP